jgi:hypothetical protein
MTEITKTPVALAREVIATGSCIESEDGILLDTFTASAIVQVADALSPGNLAKLEAMTLTQVARVCWKIAESGGKK